jgi:hypothetical protein
MGTHMMDETNDVEPQAPGTSGILPAAGASGSLDGRKKRGRSPSSSTGTANSISQEKKKACLAMGACEGPEPKQGAAGAQPGNLDWVEASRRRRPRRRPTRSRPKEGRARQGRMKICRRRNANQNFRVCTGGLK